MPKFFLLLFLIGVLVLHSSDSLKLCKRSPSWRLSGKVFPRDFYGQVKLIALLKASCPFCRQQARDMAKLKEELKKEHGISDVDFVIINAHERKSILEVDEFKEAAQSVHLVQDIEKMDVWRRYNGTTDDMLILDR